MGCHGPADDGQSQTHASGGAAASLIGAEKGFEDALQRIAGLGACHRGSWHDPERMQSRMDSIEEDLADDLEIRPGQQEAFHAVSGRIKALSLDRLTQRRNSIREIKTEFEKDTVNIDRVGTLLKQYVQARPANGELESIIDETTAFYKTLDAEQKVTFNKKVARKLKWWD